MSYFREASVFVRACSRETCSGVVFDGSGNRPEREGVLVTFQFLTDMNMLHVIISAGFGLKRILLKPKSGRANYMVMSVTVNLVLPCNVHF